ncbi:MAG: hypothetical protein KGL21_01070 [Alphaproteobacteria bacterium]|nr:hypothetical protein [Alphaproteobacteria bacterium]
MNSAMEESFEYATGRWLPQRVRRLNPHFTYSYHIQSGHGSWWNMLNRIIILGCVCAAFAATAAPVRRRDMNTPYRETRQGVLRPLSEIEASVVPGMKRRGCTYIGAEYDPNNLQYRLKFMNDGNVIWIDVDGRSGKIVAQAGL